ncbi:unnamed protein product [Arctogadus glacialis]
MEPTASLKLQGERGEEGRSALRITPPEPRPDPGVQTPGPQQHRDGAVNRTPSIDLNLCLPVQSSAQPGVSPSQRPDLPRTPGALAPEVLHMLTAPFVNIKKPRSEWAGFHGARELNIPFISWAPQSGPERGQHTN